MYTSRYIAESTLDDPRVLERRRLVRLCARLSGDVDAAEDLAQETLLEAWRNAHKLRDPSGRPQWLAAIARLVCLRWRRRQCRLARQELPLRDDIAVRFPASEQLHSAAGAIEHALERNELARLLEQALALLPADTRKLLAARYIHEATHAEIAANTGLSEAAVRLKLHRGRLALRHALQTTLREAAAPYGLDRDTGDDWQATQIWCPLCGRQRLMCSFVRASGSFLLRCPDCCPDYRSPGSANLAHMQSAELFRGISGVKPALSRLMRHGDAYLQQALATRTAPCMNCGRSLPLQMDPPSYRCAPRLQFGIRGVYTTCDACQSSMDMCLKGIALWSAGGRRFWQQQRKVRSLPEREIVADGRPAILITYRSLGDDLDLDVLFAHDSYRIVGVHTTANRPVVVVSEQRGRA